MSGAFSTAKPACSTLPLWSLPTLPIWPSTSPPSLQAVLDLRRRAHVEQGAQDGLVLGLDVGAADQVGRVLAVGHPARRAARRAVLAEREYRGAARLGVHERVGVDRDEQVGLDPARLLDALVQRHEEVGVAGQHRAHVRVRVDPVAQQHRDRQHDVLLVQPARPARAGIFAAVAGVDGDDDEAIDLGLREFRRQRRPDRARSASRCRGRASAAPTRERRRRRPSAIVPPAPAALAIAGPGVDAAAPAAPTRPMNSPSASCTDCAAFCSACSRSRISSSRGSRSCGRMQVEDESVPVRRDRREREQLAARSPA